MATFESFRADARVLRDLAEHNEKPWFDAHRDDYERWWLAPARAFVEAIVEHCMTHWRAALPIHRWLVDTLQR